MSIQNKLGQLFFIGLEGTELKGHEAKFIVDNNIGGVTLFGRNIESPEQVHKLCSDLQGLRHKTEHKLPLFIAIDMEGGRVHRLPAPFTQWPAVKNLGDLDSTSLTFKYSLSMGQELKAVGINMDFAPCVDLLTNPKNELIGDRSLGSDPELVAKMGSALVRGYVKSGVVACSKHFPGHGNTIVDSHVDLPVDSTDLSTLMDRELVPFKKTFRARVDFVMTAHIKFDKIDPELPVTLSKKFITDLLKNELRYQKLVITDDLDMKALRNHYEIADIPVMAMQAGCDILLYCNEFDVPPKALASVTKAIELGKVSRNHVEEAYEKVVSVKQRCLKDCDPPKFEEAAKIIGHPEHLSLAKAVAEKKIPQDLVS